MSKTEAKEQEEQVAKLLEFAHKHNKQTLITKLKKDGFSLNEAQRHADIIMPERKSNENKNASCLPTNS
jgi:hypothetical protein